jgi:aerobic C4-dicarboxylate transport protein
MSLARSALAQTAGGRRVNIGVASHGIAAETLAGRSRPLYRRLYVKVLCAILIGAALGHWRPEFAQQMKPLGDLFIRLIKMMIEPIVFTTVVVGVGKMGSMKEVGRVGLRALVYFEIVSSIALLLGLLVANLYRPGTGIRIDATALDAGAIAGYASGAKALSPAEFLMHVVPDSVVGAFAKGDTLQVVFFSVLFGLALSALGSRVRPLIDIVDQVSQGMFRVIGIIMVFAPLGAFGAMAFTIGKYGLGTLQHLGMLLAGVYTTCLLFIFLVLGLIARCTGFSLWRFLLYIREEIAIVFATSTSESALPALMLKLETLGCEKSIVGLVVPTGYSFNLDGTSIYLSMAVLFIAQAGNVELSWHQQLGILGFLLFASKGSAAVTGGGFITLAATISSFDSLPVAGLALLLGVDRFMSEARAITNLIGNGVATIAIGCWEGSVDRDRMNIALNDVK